MSKGGLKSKKSFKVEDSTKEEGDLSANPKSKENEVRDITDTYRAGLTPDEEKSSKSMHDITGSTGATSGDYQLDVFGAVKNMFRTYWLEFLLIGGGTLFWLLLTRKKGVKFSVPDPNNIDSLISNLN